MCFLFNLKNFSLFFHPLPPMAGAHPRCCDVCHKCRPTVADRHLWPTEAYIYRLNFHSFQLVVSGITHFSDELMLVYPRPPKLQRSRTRKTIKFFLPFPIFAGVFCHIDFKFWIWNLFDKMRHFYRNYVNLRPKFYGCPHLKCHRKFWAKIVKFLV